MALVFYFPDFIDISYKLDFWEKILDFHPKFSIKDFFIRFLSKPILKNFHKFCKNNFVKFLKFSVYDSDVEVLIFKHM